MNNFGKINRGSIFYISDTKYILFTYQINGRSFIIRNDYSYSLEIDLKNIFLCPSENYERMSVMNPYIFYFNKNYYLFYSAGDTYEPDYICMALIDNICNQKIEKYIFNPVFKKGNKFYNLHKVAFGDIICLDDFVILFYIGYYNIHRAYINIAFCKKNTFPFFKDVDELNPLIGPKFYEFSSVYKPCIFKDNDKLIIYFNRRIKRHETICYSVIEVNKIIKVLRKLSNEHDK